MDRLKNKRFWVSLVALVIMVARLFGVSVDTPYINEILDSLCAVCILIGLGSGDKTANTSGDSDNSGDETSGNPSSDDPSDENPSDENPSGENTSSENPSDEPSSEDPPSDDPSDGNTSSGNE